MHLILVEHCRPNTVELDKSIFGDYCFSPKMDYKCTLSVSMSEFKNRFSSIIYRFFNSQRRTVKSCDNE